MTTWAKEENVTISRAWYGVEDHGLLTCKVYLDGDGWYQVFGDLALDKDTTGPSFASGLCAAFGVTKLDELAGISCVALYAFGNYHSPVEGLRGPHGTFSLNAWRQSIDPTAPSLMELRRAELLRDVQQRQRMLDDARSRLAAFDAEQGRG